MIKKNILTFRAPANPPEPARIRIAWFWAMVLGWLHKFCTLFFTRTHLRFSCTLFWGHICSRRKPSMFFFVWWLVCCDLLSEWLAIDLLLSELFTQRWNLSPYHKFVWQICLVNGFGVRKHYGFVVELDGNTCTDVQFDLEFNAAFGENG